MRLACLEVDEISYALEKILRKVEVAIGPPFGQQRRINGGAAHEEQRGVEPIDQAVRHSGSEKVHQLSFRLILRRLREAERVEDASGNGNDVPIGAQAVGLALGDGVEGARRSSRLITRARLEQLPRFRILLLALSLPVVESAPAVPRRDDRGRVVVVEQELQ
jgi:hypothetical protein